MGIDRKSAIHIVFKEQRYCSNDEDDEIRQYACLCGFSYTRCTRGSGGGRSQNQNDRSCRSESSSSNQESASTSSWTIKGVKHLSQTKQLTVYSFKVCQD